jgi:hypothetical protein
MDDVIITAESLESHSDRLRELFQRLRESNLKIEPFKCEFLRAEVQFLGHRVSDKDLLPDPKKTEVVRNFPEPKTVKQLRGFLGLSSYYRRFIQNYSKVAQPLHDLLKKNASYDWKEPQQHAFQTLKELLTTAPILQFPDFSRPLIVTTDASCDAADCILSQGEIGRDLPIAFASRTFNKAERNYSTTDREIVAIVWAVKQLRPYVLGRHFSIVTDHKPLKWVFNIKDPS